MNRLFERVRSTAPDTQKLVWLATGTAALVGAAIIFPGFRKKLVGAAERSGQALWAIPGVKEHVHGLVDRATERTKALGSAVTDRAATVVGGAADRVKTFLANHQSLENQHQPGLGEQTRVASTVPPAEAAIPDSTVPIVHNSPSTV